MSGKEAFIQHIKLTAHSSSALLISIVAYYLRLTGGGNVLRKRDKPSLNICNKYSKEVKNESLPGIVNGVVVARCWC